MPTITEDIVDGYAHCPNPRCDPYEHATKIVKQTIEWTYLENGGDFPGFERSVVNLIAGEETDAVCPGCGRTRELSIAERPEYPNDSGVDPMGLLGMQPQTADPNLMAAQERAAQDARIAELEAKLEALAEKPAAPAKKAPAKDAA